MAPETAIEVSADAQRYFVSVRPEREEYFSRKNLAVQEAIPRNYKPF